MSKKSAVLLVGLGLAATAAGAWVVRRRSVQLDAFEADAIETDAIETDTVAASGVDAPVVTQWTGDNKDGVADELAAAADDEPVNVR